MRPRPRRSSPPTGPSPIAGLFFWLLLVATVFLLYVLVSVIRALVADGF